MSWFVYSQLPDPVVFLSCLDPDDGIVQDQRLATFLCDFRTKGTWGIPMYRAGLIVAEKGLSVRSVLYHLKGNRGAPFGVGISYRFWRSH